MSYIESAKKILGAYDGVVPFASFLKNYFRENKKHGSRDRKFISQLCYPYFRLGKAFRETNLDEQLLVGQYLCSDSSNIFLDQLRPELNDTIQESLNEKFKILGSKQFIFPYLDEVSAEIEKAAFDRSFLVQPDLFLRIRPGKKAAVLDKLKTAGVDFVIENETCLRLPINTRVEDVLEIDEEVVVQDYNSQRVIQFSELSAVNNHRSTRVWDCCAASGGKSILMYDEFPNMHLTVSDIRESILFNLKKRFARAGIRNYKSFLADLSQSNCLLPISHCSLVICDAPCSGSGTWGRTPEQLVFFEKEKIEHYAGLQKKIALNASKALTSGGYFLYITCSVFKKENEDVVEFISNNTPMKLMAQQYLKGYTIKADTLFAALFRL